MAANAKREMEFHRLVEELQEKQGKIVNVVRLLEVKRGSDLTPEKLDRLKHALCDSPDYILIKQSHEYFLSTYIDRTQKEAFQIPEIDIWRMFSEITGALSMMHHLHHIVVRDLCPSTIRVHIDDKIVSREAQLYLSDFVNAKVPSFRVRPQGDSPASSFYVKDLRYVAPEILAHQSYQYPNADLWSVACIIFELAAGVPFIDDPENELDLSDPNVVLQCIFNVIGKPDVNIYSSTIGRDVWDSFTGDASDRISSRLLARGYSMRLVRTLEVLLQVDVIGRQCSDDVYYVCLGQVDAHAQMAAGAPDVGDVGDV